MASVKGGVGHYELVVVELQRRSRETDAGNGEKMNWHSRMFVVLGSLEALEAPGANHWSQNMRVGRFAAVSQTLQTAADWSALSG